MKYSKQREMILDVLHEHMVHPSADYVYDVLKKDLPSISLATVYRNLNQLAQNGMIRKIESLDGVAHFDHNLSKHYHFICTNCNKVYDVPCEVAPDLCQNVLAQTGLIVESLDISFKGICPECLKLKKTN